METRTKVAVVLLSGGLDSAVCAGIANRERNRIIALSLDYGQTHVAELAAAAQVAQHYGADHRVIPLRHMEMFRDCSLIAGDSAPARQDGLPASYVPARNLLFLSVAAGIAEAVGAGEIFVGVNSEDYSGYPDCRPDFIQSFQATLDLATAAGVAGNGPRVRAPLQRNTKAEIVQIGMRLGTPIHLTVSCYRADETGAACSTCPSCAIRRAGFAAARQPDPTRYQRGQSA